MVVKTLMTPIKLLFISKPNCHLCDEMWKELMEASHNVGLRIKTHSLQQGDSFYEQYYDKVPVLLINGEEAFRYRASASEIIEAIRRKEW